MPYPVGVEVGHLLEALATGHTHVGFDPAVVQQVRNEVALAGVALGALVAHPLPAAPDEDGVAAPGVEEIRRRWFLVVSLSFLKSNWITLVPVMAGLGGSVHAIVHTGISTCAVTGIEPRFGIWVQSQTSAHIGIHSRTDAGIHAPVKTGIRVWVSLVCETGWTLVIQLVCGV